MAKYEDWLKTFYTSDNHGKEIVWGKILDIVIKDIIPMALVYIPKNPLGCKVHAINFNKIKNWVLTGVIWSPRKKQ